MGCWAFGMQATSLTEVAYECVEQVFVKVSSGRARTVPPALDEDARPVCRNSGLRVERTRCTPSWPGKREPRPDAQVLALSSLRRNTVISFSACLSPCVAAAARPCSQACRAPARSPAAWRALPSSFQPAEYFGSCSTQTLEVFRRAFGVARVQVALAQAEAQQRIVHAFGQHLFQTFDHHPALFQRCRPLCPAPARLCTEQGASAVAKEARGPFVFVGRSPIAVRDRACLRRTSGRPGTVARRRGCISCRPGTAARGRRSRCGCRRGRSALPRRAPARRWWCPAAA